MQNDTGTNKTPPKLTPVFNQLSVMGKFTLISAAMTLTIARIARDDTKDQPWKYPLYVTYLSLVVLSMPIPGPNVMPILLALWAGAGLAVRSPWARWVFRSFQDSFNREKLIAAHDDFITPDSAAPGKFRIRALPLAKDTVKKAWADLGQARRYYRAWRGKPPSP